MKNSDRPANAIISKIQLIKEIKQGVKEMKLIKTGKKQARNAEDFLSEL